MRPDIMPTSEAVRPTERNDNDRSSDNDRNEDEFVTELSNKSQINLHNHETGRILHDTFHATADNKPGCSSNICTGSIVLPPVEIADVTSPESSRTEELLKEAKRFNQEYHKVDGENNNGAAACRRRWQLISAEILTTGSYELTADELLFGARLAWRNSQRCIGRAYWKSLTLLDARGVENLDQMFEYICNHLVFATNKGNLRSAITVFPADGPDKPRFRIWNQQLISYAGYRTADGSYTGDKANVDFTQVCCRLGWKGKGSPFDVLPIVLSMDKEVRLFTIPDDLLLTVKIIHPQYDGISGLGLEWYAVPAVSGMLFECGGLQFPAAPFSGIYMNTEVAARDFCDTHRYDMLQRIADSMSLDTSHNRTLWKDRALVEINYAVLYSFKRAGVTIFDHHTMSDSFVRFLGEEHRTRGGCPADWVWIVPPVSGCVTSVFHQEMLRYVVKPTFSYQKEIWKEPAWTGCVIKEPLQHVHAISGSMQRAPANKYTFRKIARLAIAVRRLCRPIVVVGRSDVIVLYASETGTAERYAGVLGHAFSHVFRVHVVRMDQFDTQQLQRTAVLLVIASTFGNGDPPENGNRFFKALHDTSFLDGLRNRKLAGTGESDHKRCYAVLALGSSMFPNFCTFGKKLDQLLRGSFGDQLLPVRCADEVSGQEQTFHSWTADVFQKCCKTVGLNSKPLVGAVLSEVDPELTPSAEHVRLMTCPVEDDLISGHTRVNGRRVLRCQLVRNNLLHLPETDRKTIGVVLRPAPGSEVPHYSPGDHLAVIPRNRAKDVQTVLCRLQSSPSGPVQLQTRTDSPSTGAVEWRAHDKLPCASVETMLSRYLDISAVPSQHLLRRLSQRAADPSERARLHQLATDETDYVSWRNRTRPSLADVLRQFRSVQVEPDILLANLPLITARQYSISSSQQMHPSELHLTVAIVRYRCPGSKSSLRYGLCSQHLYSLMPGDDVYAYIRRNPGFQMPDQRSSSMLLVAQGTGVSPFRAFWQQRLHQISTGGDAGYGSMRLYFGCRHQRMDIYAEEKENLVKQNVLSSSSSVYSRQQDTQKEYVQHRLQENSDEVLSTLTSSNGHMYICGDCSMAEDVRKTLIAMFIDKLSMSSEQALTYMENLRDTGRIHEDILGVPLHE